jgi:RNA polymerase sigma-70 factor (ECF subfamily)
MPWDLALPNPLAGEADAAAQHTAAHVDNSVFAGFYERSARPLWAYLVRASSDAALADDLMQESYVRFLCAEHAPSLAEDGEVAARLYLFRIATNLLHDHWRRPRAASIDELPEELFSIEGDAAQTESQAELGPALRRMKPRERQLLWLAHAEGYSHREIAQVTGLATASIRLLLFRARRKIARILREQQQPAGGSQ